MCFVCHVNVTVICIKNCALYVICYLECKPILICNHYPTKVKVLKLSWIKRLCNNTDANWKILPKYFFNNCDNLNFNFKPKIATLKNLLSIWKQRSLSIKGQITIVNTIALYPLIYASCIIETPPEAFKEISDIIQNFIWKGKTAKIAQNTLVKNIDQGGLKLCHYPTIVKALKLSWIKRLCNNTDVNWEILPKYFYNCNNLILYFSANTDQQNKPTFYTYIHDLYMSHFKKRTQHITIIMAK